MLVVCAKVLAKAEKLDLVKTELLKLIEPTRAEAGCISYELHQDNENPNLFFFFEHWESLEILEKHLATQHIANYVKNTEGCLDEFTVQKLTKIS
ncbi:MAG: putative quinol monooxygenase [Opitutales bacterium]